MISKERAVERVESLLATSGLPHEPVVHGVEEHAFGWLIVWDSAEYARTRDPRDSLVGGGPYLVDRYDGSVHHIPVTTWVGEGWEELYLRQVRGVRAPDPLAASVRALVDSAGTVAAMNHLRKRAPRLGLQEAKAYVMAVRDGSEPPHELADLTREEEVCPPLAIETLAGPDRQRSA
ncbi:YrhB domain-containing protein [Streptomyces sp. NPDC088915]|uniref:YrhB domain-containing protein n=1 Tax=Streptomyces sp. NPDC088915 TaxID=3365912 RepID=UPI0037F25E67